MPMPPRATRPARAARARRFSMVGVLAGLAGLLALLTVPTSPAAATAGAPAYDTASTAVTATAASGGTGSPVVLVGLTGLRWDDLGSLTTPALWSLARQGAVGTTVVRSVRPSSCPADGWLAVSTGTRAADLPSPDGTCRRLHEPVAGSAVPGWADFRESAAAGSFSAHVGLLGDALAAGGATVTGIGPGAAIALADATGTTVGDHVPLPTDPTELTGIVRGALVASDLVVVDAGSVRDPGEATQDPAAADAAQIDTSAAVTEPTRSEQAQAVDARVRAVLAAVNASKPDITVLVVSLADAGRSPQLQLAIASGPAAEGDGTYSGALLGSRSTRQDGYLQSTDITPTLLSALGLRADAAQGALIGSPVTAVGGPPVASARVAALLDANRRAQAARSLIPGFYLTLVGINLLLCLLVTVGLNGRVLARWSRVLDNRWQGQGRRVAAAFSQPGAVLRSLRTLGVAVAAIPVSTFLANLTPWWRASPPSYALAAAVVAWVLVITAIALVPPWRDTVLVPLGIVSAITAVVLCVDIAAGARLQLSSLMGPQALVAGRFYGFNNSAFALVAAASILLAVAVADPLVARGRRRLAAGVVALIGVVVTALDGLPSIGADFGGPPALVPGFAILALLTAGIRLSWWRTHRVCGAGAATVTAFAVVDYLRPPDSRTHLGRFVETVLDGGAWPVVERKLAQNLSVLGGGVVALLVVAGLVVVVVVLGRLLRRAMTAPGGGSYGWLSAGVPLKQLGTDIPMLRPGLIALAVTMIIGFVLNDSGIVIPALGIAVAVPLIVSLGASWLIRRRPSNEASPTTSPAPSAVAGGP
ncbi:MAG: hypothetical protein HHJ14_03455 [Cellulomonas sp.]|nr:hypothetical protein [Cellulomonas sp.]